MTMPEHILIVDDEAAIAEPLAFSLQQHGFSNAHVTTAQAARRYLRDNAPDLLILDLGLPDCDGLQLCRDIREEYDLPVIMLTARAEESDRILGLEWGADDYVTKPFSPREVVARVRAVLRRVGDDSKAIRRLGVFEHDARRRQIRCKKAVLDLARYEYALLQFLLEHPGWVFSRQELLRRIWDDPDMSGARTVDTHIKTLRAKLHKVCPGVEFIETRRGHGYALVEDAGAHSQ